MGMAHTAGVWNILVYAKKQAQGLKVSASLSILNLSIENFIDDEAEKSMSVWER